MKAGVVSLKRRLLFWLLVPLGLMAAALVTEAYLSARESAVRIHDNLLVTTALSISEHVVGTEGDLVPDEILDLMTASTHERTYYQVTGPGNAFITGHDDLPPVPGGAELKGGQPHFFDATYLGQDVRIVVIRFLVQGRDIDGWMAVQVAQTHEGRNALVFDTVARSALRISLVIGLAVVFAWVGIHRGLAPLNQMQDAIRRRSYDDLRPIKHEMPKEVSHVVLALNQLLDRLTTSIASSQQFIADASHQLRTPLAALQAKTELALRDARDDEEWATLQGIHADTQHTSRLANQLLSLARTRPESGGDIKMTTIDLNRVAAGLTEEWVRRVLDKGADLGFDGDSTLLSISGNETLIRELLANLIDNALRYGTNGTQVTVRTGTDADTGRVLLEVEDDGPGIPDDMKGKVTERFVRLNERDGDGCGLGLAIVCEITERHGGNVDLVDGSSGGVLVRISLPLENAHD